MNTMKLVLGVVLIVAGAVLALLLPEVRFLWFEGRPLGIVLAVVGVFELGEEYVRSRRADREVSGG